MQLTLDASEAEQALHILDKEADHLEVTQDDWQELFATVPYQWLKEREIGIGRAFTDEVFELFLQKPETISRRAEWHDTLANFEKANMTELGVGVLTWLPTGATTRARDFPEIKPVNNCFVWSKQGEGHALCIRSRKTVSREV